MWRPYTLHGDDCLDVTKAQSTDFARATALLNAAQFLTQDMSCTDSATEEGAMVTLTKDAQYLVGNQVNVKLL